MNKNNKIYLVSLYYEKKRVTGANKRFDYFGSYLSEKADCGDIDLTVIVRDGEVPKWAKHYVIIPRYDYLPSVVRRIVYFIYLSIIIFNINGVVINDYMPIPLYRKKRVNFYQLVHDIRNFTDYNRAIMKRISSFIQKKQWQSVSKILTVSQFTKDQLIKFCNVIPDNIRVSYNGIDNIEPFNTSNAQRDIDFLYIATFEKRKNHENLIKAFYKYLVHHKNAKLILIGRDLGYRNRIDALINSLYLTDNIQIIESISENDLVELYKRTRVFISPSFYEGFGMPIIEALYFGCLVTCSNIEVFKEIAGNYAIYFDPSDVDDIFKAMISCQTKTLNASEQLKYIENRFTWKVIVDDFLKSVGA